MQVFTIGGATQDIFLNYKGTDSVTIEKNKNEEHYLLFASGEKIEVDKIFYTVGGGATNSAVSFQRQGFEATPCCKIGADQAGNFIFNSLIEQKINTSLIHKSNNHETGKSFIISSYNNERTIFAYRGANNHLDLANLICNTINTAQLLYITSLSNESAKILPDLVSCAHKANIPIVINPGASQLTSGSEDLKNSLQYVKALILNKSEAYSFMVSLIESSDVYKKKLKTTNTPSQKILPKTAPYLLENPIIHDDNYFSIQRFFKEVLNMGPQIVAITNGANGVYVATKNDIYFHPSIDTNVVDTVGAGDAFGSCFAGSIIQGHSIENALRRGIINSASVLQFIGAKQGLLRKEELDKQLEALDKTLLQKFSLLP